MIQCKFECALGNHKCNIPKDCVLSKTYVCACGKKGHWKSPDGYDVWYDYDDKGNEIHWKDSNGHEGWYDYDDKGNEIHSKTSSGYERWSYYNDKGNLIHWKNSNGYCIWYDEKHWVDTKPENWKYEKYVTT